MFTLSFIAANGDKMVCSSPWYRVKHRESVLVIEFSGGGHSETPDSVVRLVPPKSDSELIDFCAVYISNQAGKTVDHIRV